MRALTWQGKHDVRVETVADPQIVNPRDAIIRITSTAICGSDLHLYDHTIPGMKHGDILGHEFMGEVVEVGSGNKKLKVGQRVVVPFVIACGKCFFCQKQQFAACDNSNPADKSDPSEIAYGYPMAAAFGYSHLTGGYAGGQAEFARVPYSDIGPIVIPEGIDDDKVLFLSDILPTGWMAAVNCDIEPGDVVAVWGCGPVGLFAIQSALLLGAHRVIAIDHHPRRLALARALGAEVLDFEEVKVREALAEMTGGIGPDACIDAVGMESHGMSPDNMLDHVKVATFMATDRVHALATGDPRHAQGRTRIDPRSVRRRCRQIPHRRAHGEGAADQERADPRAEVHARAARSHPGRQDRHHVPDQPSARSRRCSGGLQELQGKAERIHQGGAQATLYAALESFSPRKPAFEDPRCRWHR